MGSHSAYRFGDLTLDLGRRSLERDGEPIELGKLTYTLLVALVESAPNVLTHADLEERVWAGRLTSPETVQQRVKLLRQALRDEADRPRYIGVVRGQGYRLIPLVERLLEPGAVPPNEPDGALTPRFAPSSRRRAAAAVVVILAFIAAAYFAFSRFAGSDASATRQARTLDYEITQITTGSGGGGWPAISPEGNFVVYVRVGADRQPRSLWVHQIATGSDVQVLPADPVLFAMLPTVSPDGNFIDFLRTGPGIPRALWRVPFLGDKPAVQVTDFVSSPVGWSPDGKRAAFVRYDRGGGTSLVVRNADGEERVLATRTVPTFFVSSNVVGVPPVRPAWSPDGRLIALFEFTDLLKPRLTFVDAETGNEETSLDTQGSFVPSGIGWLGPSTLALSQPAGLGQRGQLWRMSYPSGEISPLTNDLSSYHGIDLDRSRTRLVTQRRDRRIAVWLGDSFGPDFEEIVPWMPYGGENLFTSWAGDRLLYDATFNGRSVIAAIEPGGASSPEIVSDAFHVAAAPDGETIVFSSPVRGREGLWRIDGSGRPPVQLVSGFAVEPVVTADRQVVFVTNRSGVQSPWIVPLAGGDATEIVREVAVSRNTDVSPDGRRLAFYSARTRGIVVCDLPRCENRLELPAPTNYAETLRWTADGNGLGYLVAPLTDIWVMPLDGGAPRAVTSFGPDASAIASFAWSRDGRQLAFVRVRTEYSVVMLSGLRP